MADLWLLSEGHCFRELVLQVCGMMEQTGSTNPIRFESGSLETLRLLVDEAGGMTLLPYLATRVLGPAAAQHLLSFSDPAPQRTVSLIYGRAYLKRALIEAYADVLLETVVPVLPQG
jgi:LysR family hydrogen peroxide-inducible transcriptional activator